MKNDEIFVAVEAVEKNLFQRAILKPENWNPKSNIWNPESGTGNWNRNGTIKENQVFEHAKIICMAFAGKKNKRPSKEDLKLFLFWNKNSPSVEIRATVFSSEGYNNANLNKVLRNLIPSV